MNSILDDSNTTTELSLFCFLLQATFVNLCETSPGYQLSKTLERPQENTCLMEHS